IRSRIAPFLKRCLCPINSSIVLGLNLSARFAITKLKNLFCKNSTPFFKLFLPTKKGYLLFKIAGDSSAFIKV
ncbi:MAG: hypothetical protein C0197_06100, partial [Caldimicrobium thiodismutans]